MTAEAAYDEAHDATRALPLADGSRPGPHGTRLLAGWFRTGRAADLTDHLDRYGPLPATAPAPLRQAVDEAGLTGRGGAAFPTGRKLSTVAAGRGPAVVVANGMESEPGSLKDQTLLQLAPHLVLDGIALAARAVGANAAHLCVARTRTEQVRALRGALAERVRLRLDPVPVQLHELPHHYVSSEESALVHWLNGGDARPTATPPRPFERGVGKRPTLVDNVETLAQLTLIARYGPAWYREAGAPDAPGTTLVTLSGAVHHPGVYEAPMGARLGQLLDHAGAAAERLSAVLVGGYFGSWLPAEAALSARFTKQDLAQLGAGPGAGVLVALPERACGLAETADVLGFLARNSAQQCGPCRFGLPAVAEDFAALAAGRLDGPSLTRLEQRVGLLAGRGACRHPDGASRLAATALQTFAADVARHVQFGPCGGASTSPVLAVPQGAVPGPQEWR
ncbi:NADH-ubiquinone oxidoreductase-F iron-sulfur binding region domain-containing protein [Streptacidiphilus jiangxiensis]|uniref:NADH:ubiquinone oxidoreductase, NADH-binding subunit (Chain F) n=1 Tax=Streptacidiphilus jiangxiensis TaxID=235985 RepID=A0A1H7V555_STRJI|nr:NADH-ubiquinone oxidoreductase-F iron-sulfur binding region domain-containing protein [Streptacidiphilus jiangxiensis]SEM04220.1 NADH:ubiquinone oxidoreductase, NADH-binding subunit (chain F) [Streptacidiphilus jiangxiensis]